MRLAKILFLVCLLTGGTASAQAIYTGVDFWLAFPYNTSGSRTLEVKISSDYSTTGTITTGAGMNQAFAVSPGSPFQQTFTYTTYEMSSNQVIESNKWVHIVSNDPVTVFAGSIALGGGDAVSVIENTYLGQEFRITGYRNLNPGTILIVGVTNGTNVAVTPSCATLGGTGAGSTANITLNQGQTYMVRANCDLTGSTVTADQPIQVFSHSRCSQVPNGASYCDFIWATALPVNMWGTEYATGASGGRNGNDRYRIMAHTAGTSVYINGGLVATLNAGQFHEVQLSGGNQITANNPIHVTQFLLSNSVGGGSGDPAMVQLVPTDMFANTYRFPTMNHANISSHWLTLVSRTAGTASVRLDGAAVGGWTSFTGGWSYARTTIGAGDHTVTGDSAVHGVLHGWNSVNSYGNPIGGEFIIVVLPLPGHSLEGRHESGKGNVLQWKRSTGVPLQGGQYVLQRSKDMRSVQKVFETEYEPGITEYSHLDSRVASGERWYYRLTYRDENGEEQAGEWVEVLSSSDPAPITVFPTLVQDEISIRLDLSVSAKVDMELLDAAGKLLRSESRDFEAGLHTLSLRDGVSELPAGTYILNITAGGETWHEKIIKY